MRILRIIKFNELSRYLRHSHTFAFFALCFLLFTFLFLLLNFAYAVETSNKEGPAGIDITVDDITRMVTGLACWATRIVIPIIVIMIIYYGVWMLGSRGNPDNFNKAKKGLGYAIIGMLIILGTYTIIATVANALSGGKYDYSLIVPLRCGPVQDVKTNIRYEGEIP